MLVRDLDTTSTLAGSKLSLTDFGSSEERSWLLTTLVSLLSRNGTARPRCAIVSGVALDWARTLKERRYPELAGDLGGFFFFSKCGFTPYDIY